MAVRLALAYLLFAALPASAQQRPATIDDVLNVKAVASPQLSPDGTRVIYTVRQWEPESAQQKERMAARTRIWQIAVSGGPARQITFGERGDTDPQWSPDGRYISFISARGAATDGEDPRGQIYLLSADGGEAAKLTDAKEGVTSYAWSPDGLQIAYVTRDPRSADEDAAIRRRDDERVFEGDFRYAHIWTIGVESRTATRLTEGTQFTVDGAPSWAPDSARVTFSAKPTPMIRDYRGDIYIADVRSRAVEKITPNPGADSQPQWSPNGKHIAFLAQLNAAPAIADGTLPSVVAHDHLMLYDTATRRITDAARTDFDIEPGAPRWSADSTRVLFTASTRTANDLFAFIVATGRYARLTEGRTLTVGSQAKDGRTFALTIDGPTSPPEVHVADQAFRSFRKLTDTNPQIASLALGQTEVVRWRSDGVDVEGILVKPVGAEAGKRYPLLVVAHGGPASVWPDRFRSSPLDAGHVWAGQGWAVLYPNPRGSTSYGEAFLRANVNDWGGGDYRDVMAGVDALVARGLADPARLALMGWSYGGYMTAWTITQTTRFKAAMVGAGITNLWSMYGTNDVPNVLTTYFGGIAGAQAQRLYVERSAMSHVDKITTPTLIVHGAADERVPASQGMELFRALRDRGRKTELVLYPREGHGLTEYYHLKDYFTRLQDWITTNTLGTPRPTATQ